MTKNSDYFSTQDNMMTNGNKPCSAPRVVSSGKKETDEDSRLRTLFSALPAAEASPWFTRRVLHRLPDRRRRIAGLVEYTVYIVGLIWLLVIGVLYASRNLSDGLTLGDLTSYLFWLAIVGALAFALVEPRFSAIGTEPVRSDSSDGPSRHPLR